MNDIDRIPFKQDEERVKDKDLFETVEEVFDTATVMTIIELIRRRVIKKLNGVINSGKEARIYLGYDLNNKPIAVKIYLTSTSEFKKGMHKYIKGDPRFNGIKLSNTKLLVYTWAKKEFRNLKRMYEAGVKVPKPIACLNNVLVMEFLGENNTRYPLLIEAYGDLEEDELERIYSLVIDEIEKIACKARLVHGDISEYNIVVKPSPEIDIFLIDVGQAIDLSHPSAWELLLRDIRNINRFFSKKTNIIVLDEDKIVERVKPCLEKRKES
ncbi:MAG: serine protein kinase RIO [Desulfurococcaceae archaeon]